jgi:hypothetical protein
MHDRKKGFFISFDYSGDAMTEASQFFKKTGKMIIPLTVQEILDGHIAHKLARGDMERGHPAPDGGCKPPLHNEARRADGW